MKKILNFLFEYKTLSYEQARKTMISIGEGAYNDASLTAFMSAFLMRTISIEELRGFRDALLEMALPADLSGDLVDIVGTGGDGKNTFNISTLSSFIVAGTGQKVAKHGNYASSSVTGSSNLMEALGYRFKNDSCLLQDELDDANICFLHAPLFHPALKVVSGIRKQLGVRTVFNMLGPLVNPAVPTFRMLGVYNAETARMYNYLLQQDNCNFSIVNSLDGHDEVSLTADTKLITKTGEKICTAISLGGRKVEAAEISGGETIDDAAHIFINVIKGDGTAAQNAVVLANAAVAMVTTGKYGNYETAFSAAKESLESGKAFVSFKKLLS